MRVSVVIEEGSKRAFASALEWPGWSRSGRATDAALEALLAAAPRYGRVTARARLAFDPPDAVGELDVVERLPGGGGTDFGVPGAVASAEAASVPETELERFVAILEACWAEFDATAEAASGRTLATGPRGGGRQLAKIREHVRDAEVAYVGQLGAKVPDPERSREAFVSTLRAVVGGTSVEHPRNTRKPWSPRYAVRRAAWHVLDHAWEIEDRVEA